MNIAFPTLLYIFKILPLNHHSNNSLLPSSTIRRKHTTQYTSRRDSSSPSPGGSTHPHVRRQRVELTLPEAGLEVYFERILERLEVSRVRLGCYVSRVQWVSLV